MCPDENPNLSDEDKWQMLMRHEKLGELLLKLGKLHLKELEDLTAEQERTGKPLGELILERKVVTKEELKAALELQEKQDKAALESLHELQKHKNQ